MPYLNESEKNYNSLLDKIAEGLDIPEGKYQQAVERYQDLGAFLDEKINLKTNIYPQGSMRLGTVIRPLKKGKDTDYDVDLVCELITSQNNITEQELKEKVGNALVSNERYKNMLDEEGKRCWTLDYQEEDGVGFHVDVLPSIPQIISGLDSSIHITNKINENNYEWLASNPIGYADWFKEQQKFVFNKNAEIQKRAIFENNKQFYNSIDNIPDYRVKTPLQKAIQILKRHRDYYFQDKPNEKQSPISIIITTLATHLYEQEEDTYLALKNIIIKLQEHSGLLRVGRMINEDLANRGLIKKTGQKWEILNPVESTENFADKWHEDNNARARAFFEWVSAIREDLLDDLTKLHKKDSRRTYDECFGVNVVDKAVKGTDYFQFMASHNNEPQKLDYQPREVVVKSQDVAKPWRENA